MREIPKLLVTKQTKKATHPLMQRAVVQSVAHQRAKLQIIFPAHILVHGLDRRHPLRQALLPPTTPRLPPELQALFQKIPNVVSTDELEGFETVEKHDGEGGAEVAADETANVFVGRVVAQRVARKVAREGLGEVRLASLDGEVEAVDGRDVEGLDFARGGGLVGRNEMAGGGEKWRCG